MTCMVARDGYGDMCNPKWTFIAPDIHAQAHTFQLLSPIANSHTFETVEKRMAMDGVGSEASNDFLIVSDEGGGVLDLFKFFVFNDAGSGSKFLGSLQQNLDHGGVGDSDHRWIIVVSILVRKIIKIAGKPMEWTGYFMEFILNLLSLNGNLLGLISRILHGITPLSLSI